MNSENIRSYEISIWTLQDSFITVLKPANLENKGQIQEGSIELNTDGTQSLKFSIPMYLYTDGIQKENPIWYNTINGNLIENMRKIKVIFNKTTDEEEVFEFLIIKVEERHEDDQLYCDIECEGLAFHELGKIGYKISLSSDDFYDDDMKWFKGEVIGAQPKANIQYWLKKFMLPYSSNLGAHTWGYSIEMDWTAYSQGLTNRNSDKIYEEEYISSWEIQNSKLVPTSEVSFKEKERLVDLEESNIYNLTQNLAETFGVFCKYKYLYDDNYHIVGRKVIFYNNFMAEKDGYIDMTYPHSANSIQREVDSTDLVTKLYVRPVNNEDEYITIMDVGANKGREDYILNFDYLYKIGTITKEQYEEVDNYLAALQEINLQLSPLDAQLINLEEKVPEIKATLTVATNAIALDEERINSADNLLNSLTDGDSEITIGDGNPKRETLLADSKSDIAGSYYISLGTLGINAKTIKVYRTWNSAANAGSRLSNPINGGRIEYDEFGNVIAIRDLYLANLSSTTVYLTYKYTPKLYYDNVKNAWTSRLAKDQDIKRKAEAELGTIEALIADLKSSKTELLNNKKTLIANFEHMMGPAIREGYWQPDDYRDYGDSYTDIIEGLPVKGGINQAKSGNSKYTKLFWDNELFDNEQQSYYEIGINQENKNYPCINLDGKVDYIKAYIDELSFLFYDYEGTTAYPRVPRNIKSFHIGSQCQYGFAQYNNKIVPVLILTGVDSMSDEQITYMKNSGAPQIGVLSTSVSNSTINTTITNNFSVNSSMWITPTSLYYLRFKVSSLAMKTSSDELGISYNSNALEPFEDYYTLIRDTDYYVTIKPKTILEKAVLNSSSAIDSANTEISIKFTISNASTAIYLDALQISKENAYPKVSYSISPSVIDKKFLHQTYKMLNRLVHINDIKLKFENVQGYISKVVLNLDKPYEDEIEIQNYKNKFEDLFSTIVAQTEEMKKSAYALNIAANAFSAGGGLTAEAFQQTILNNRNILQAFFDASFDDSSVVEDKLAKVFDEAGKVLKNASASLLDVQTLNSENAAILASFSENIRESFTPTIFKQNNKPYPFKVGDIWKKTENDSIVAEYIAITNSNEIGDFDSSDLAGWTRTYDGSIASITGAKLDIDAAEGIIDLKAESRINLNAKSEINLSSGDIYITGNKSVNIGSKWINIGSVGGINIVNTAITSNTELDLEGKIANETSRVILDKNGIELGASSKIVVKSGASIEIKSGASIEIKASDNSDTSTIIIDKDKGIWVGSSKGINFYSGAINSSTNSSAASVSINQSQILFGVSNTSSTTSAVKMTEDYIILSAGDSRSGLENDDILITNTVTGVKLTKNSIAFAVGNSTNRKTFIMDQNGILFAHGSTIDSTNHTGSYVLISGEGINIGSSSNLYVNTSNVKLQTNYSASDGTNTIFAIGTNLGNIQANTSAQNLKTWASGSSIGLVYNKNGLYVAGNIYASTITTSSGTIGGWTLASNILSSGSNTSYVGLSSDTSATDAIWAGHSTSSSAPFRVTRAGDIIATSGTIGGWTLSNGGRLSSGSKTTFVALDSGMSGTSTSDYAIWAGNATAGSAPFSITRGGKISAISGTIGGWNLTTVRLESNLQYTNSSNATRYAYNCIYAGDPTSSTAVTSQPFIWTGDYSSSTNHSSSSATFKVLRDGTITATKGVVGGWTLNNSILTSGSTTNSVGMSANTSTSGNNSYGKIDKSNSNSDNVLYAFWAGAVKAEDAPFRVARDGTVFVKKLVSKEYADDGTTVVYNYYNLSDSTTNSSGGPSPSPSPSGSTQEGQGIWMKPTLSGYWSSGGTYTATMSGSGKSESIETSISDAEVTLGSTVKRSNKWFADNSTVKVKLDDNAFSYSVTPVTVDVTSVYDEVKPNSLEFEYQNPKVTSSSDQEGTHSNLHVRIKVKHGNTLLYTYPTSNTYAALDVIDSYNQGKAAATVTKGTWASGSVDVYNTDDTSTNHTNSKITIALSKSTSTSIASGTISKTVTIQDSSVSTGLTVNASASVSLDLPGVESNSQVPSEKTLDFGTKYKYSATVNASGSTTSVTKVIQVPKAGLSVSGDTVTVTSGSSNTSFRITAGSLTYETTSTENYFKIIAPIKINGTNTGVNATTYKMSDHAGAYSFSIVAAYSLNGGSPGQINLGTKSVVLPYTNPTPTVTYNATPWGWGTFYTAKNTSTKLGNAYWYYSDIDYNYPPTSANLQRTYQGETMYYRYDDGGGYAWSDGEYHKYWFACKNK